MFGYNPFGGRGLSPKEKAERFTSPHRSLNAPSPDDYVSHNKAMGADKLEAENIEDGLAMLDALSHHIMGENPQESLMANKPANFRRVEQFKEAISVLNLDALSGDTLMEKSVSGAKILKAAINNSQHMDPHNSEYMNNMQKKLLRDAQEAAQEIKRSGGQKQGFFTEMFDGAKVPEDVIQELNPNMISAIAKIGKVNEMATISFQRSVDIEVDEMADKTRISYTGISYEDTMEWGEMTVDKITDYLDDVIPTTEQYWERPQKRVIFVLRDYSGSMCIPEKQGYVLAIFINLFELVYAGDAVIIEAPFTERLGKATVIETTQQAKEWLQNYTEGDAGGTDVNRSVHAAHNMIDSGNIKGYKITNKNRPEVLVINDGQDYVDPNNVPKYPTHAITLDADNDDLKQLCIKTRGTYNNIPLRNI